MTKPRLDQGVDYERGFVDGMQYQMQSSVDKAVNKMAQPEQEPVAWQFMNGSTFRKRRPDDDLDSDGLPYWKPLYTTPQIEVGCAECGVGNNHALYCVACAEKFVGEAATKLQQKQETIEGLNRDYDLLFAEHQLLLKKERVELTDEEIMKIANEVFSAYKNWYQYQLDFARALFKAQGEKNE